MNRDTKAEPNPRQGSDELSCAMEIESRILATNTLLSSGQGPKVIGVVCGSDLARRYWESELEVARHDFRARRVLSLHEDLPVGQAYGLLLLWQRLRGELLLGEGSLVAFGMGDGSRATPFTEAEFGHKPALRSFVSVESGPSRRYLTMVELALRYFAPVESHLRRSGFDGIVVKWGDEVQIPRADLRSTSTLFEGADVVRFVSVQEMTEETAASKDWVGIDEDGTITAFIPRRPLGEMRRLAELGLVQTRGSRLYGGVNLGSVAISRALLDALLEEFEQDVGDASADRKLRPNLDPQLFTALTIAVMQDQSRREEAWARARAESKAMSDLARSEPTILQRLTGMLERFRTRHGRQPRFVALDFGGQYWGDIGQHHQMYDFFMALADAGPAGRVARALANLPLEPDRYGNYLAGSTSLGRGVEVRGSVLIDARIESGSIVDSVLVGSRVGELHSCKAFDVGSTATSMRLDERAGAYRVVSRDVVTVGAGERLTTMFLDGRALLMRAHEATPLEDKARFYDIPIMGNAMSFREAHELAIGSDPEQVDRERDEAARSIAATWLE